MACSLAQAPGFGQSGGTQVSVSLPAAPTPGNLMVIMGFDGSYTAITCTGFTLQQAVIGTEADTWALYRVVQPGDTAGPYLVNTFGTPEDVGAAIYEIANASAGLVTSVGGDVTWTLSSTSMPSKSIAAAAGAIAISMFTVTTGSSVYTVGADSVSAGTYDFSRMCSNSPSNKTYVAYSHQIFGTAGTSLPTMTMPNVATTTQTEDAFTIVIGAAAVISMSDSGPSISDSLGAPPVTAPITMTDTGPTISDSLSVGASGGTVAYITLTDTGPVISDSIATAVAVALSLTDTGPSISDGFASTVAGALAFTDTGPAISDAFAFGVTLPTIFISDTGPMISDVIHLVGFLVVPEIGNAANPTGMIGNGQYTAYEIGNGPLGHLEGG